MDPRSPHLAPAKDSPHESVHVPPLLRNLPGNLVGAHGVVIRLLTEAEVVTQVDEGQGDPEPHAEQGHHSGKGHLWAQHCEAPRALKPRPGAMQWGQGPSGSQGRKGSAGHHGGEASTDTPHTGLLARPSWGGPQPWQKWRTDGGPAEP